MKTTLFGFALALVSITAITGCSSNSGGDDSSSSSDEASRAAKCSDPSDCHGLLPRTEETCSDGSSSGASWSCVESKCKITYCTDDDSTGSSGDDSNECSSADDCSGALPRNEVSCEDGSYAGAEWACKSHKCEVSYCSDNGGTAN